ncbi:flagellar hook capping FlgD N-terminal domain-containing protein [Stenotrophomonas rhizophila]|jgi:flagellar basal-body rod modification protein FlgD|uniref:flagellar hook assembly protein FlgD n=1 Tax=Stenotrophomonas TaxID=40323 RepID=UPI000B875EC8|nr:flagellar hook capping FlgD N-terminal domain-containing protein [Stenotrophomonas rhizophila]
MAVEAIGSSLGTQDSAAMAQSSSIDQEDFIRLFLAQLQFQDPLEPVDNREFLAQLAQFSALEQSRQLSENTASMLAMSASDQAVGLLNRQVDMTSLGVTRSGTVVAVQFTSSGPELSVRDAAGSVSTGVRLSQISLVKP